MIRTRTLTVHGAAQGDAEMAYHLGYPHLDPREVLSPADLLIIDGQGPRKGADEVSIPRVAGLLERAWGVTVTSGAHFCPLHVRVGSKPKCDFDVLTYGSDFFAKRRAAERLRNAGFDFDYVDADAYGKYAEEADFVQMVVPIIAHCSIPGDSVFCPTCKRVSASEQRGWPVLFEPAMRQREPFFFPLEADVLCMTAEFVQAVRRLGLTGLVDGKTLRPISTVPDPEASRPRTAWMRVGRMPTTRMHSEVDDAGTPDCDVKGPQLGEGQTLAEGDVKEWIHRLQRFLEWVLSNGGESRVVRGSEAAVASQDLRSLPSPLRVLFKTCAGFLRFNYILQTPGRVFSGGLELDVTSLGRLKQECTQWANETWVAEDAQQRERWLAAVPFAELRNGDYLALDGRERTDNPGVVYLCHDEESHLLSRSLQEFLRAWATAGSRRHLDAGAACAPRHYRPRRLGLCIAGAESVHEPEEARGKRDE